MTERSRPRTANLRVWRTEHRWLSFSSISSNISAISVMDPVSLFLMIQISFCGVSPAVGYRPQRYLRSLEATMSEGVLAGVESVGLGRTQSESRWKNGKTAIT